MVAWPQSAAHLRTRSDEEQHEHAPAPGRPASRVPRPQFVREAWLNLNGRWQFETDRGDSGLERGLRDRDLAGEIVVPFCPESELSGIGDTDFMEAVWYRRTVTVPADWAGRDVLLHFGAVDHDATVWVNGTEVARHRGGFTPFTADLRGVAGPGDEAVIVVRARDSRHGPQARGKQATWYANTHCHYTRTTGIWQTVWLEPVPAAARLKRPRITPDLGSGSFHLDLPVTGNLPGHRVRAVLSDAGGEVVTASARADLDLCPRLVLTVPEDRLRTWSPADPHLYDLRLQLLDADGGLVDEATSYAGMRSVALHGKRVLLNGEPVFQRLVLDQGYYPDGLMTAPTDADLVRDIELGLRAASTAPGSTRRCSRSATSTTPTGSATWCGESSATGAARPACATTTSAPTPVTSPSGSRPWNATTPTRRSSAGARSTRRTSTCTTASPSSTTSPGRCSWPPSRPTPAVR